MTSKDILYSKGNSDENYTPEYAVEPILKFIPEDKIVWCPFDTEESQFVKLISRSNLVTYSHIVKGQDFYNYEPDKWDIIISNPPFTNKRKIFERALFFNKPFGLLMSLAWLNDSAPKQLFTKRNLQLLMFDKRIKYIKPDGTSDNKITFSSAYYCCNFLPQQIVMENLIPK